MSLEDLMTSKLHLHLRSQALRQDANGRSRWEVVTVERTLPAAATAILICDVWDRHWSRGATERVEAMAPRMNQVVRLARLRGVQIVHAPSDTMDFYAGTPARQRVMAAPRVEPPLPREHPDPPLPIDGSDGGSDTGEQPWYPAWSRQHPAIEVDQNRDGISEDGLEIYNFMCQQGVQHLLIMGVHSAC